ncbi:hypothetical protein Fmac_020989 [Flemingia macrophylla]|uniref:J domain-containing protein n=1 Tax=Flemingia macrophylla TaxID=520843 RepID=A0ABD1LVK8_9FABA
MSYDQGSSPTILPSCLSLSSDVQRSTDLPTFPQMYGYIDKMRVLNRNASEEDLKKVYKRLARIWHPDKNPVKKAEAESKFKRISEAYDILSDPQKLQIYDLYGEEALKSGQVPPPPHSSSSSSSSSRAFHHHLQNPPPSFNFNPRDTDDIYAELFGSDDSSTPPPAATPSSGPPTVPPPPPPPRPPSPPARPLPSRTPSPAAWRTSTMASRRR